MQRIANFILSRLSRSENILVSTNMAFKSNFSPSSNKNLLPTIREYTFFKFLLFLVFLKVNYIRDSYCIIKIHLHLFTGYSTFKCTMPIILPLQTHNSNEFSCSHFYNWRILHVNILKNLTQMMFTHFCDGIRKINI